MLLSPNLKSVQQSGLRVELLLPVQMLKMQHSLPAYVLKEVQLQILLPITVMINPLLWQL
jgi:hypothetical protein